MGRLGHVRKPAATRNGMRRWTHSGFSSRAPRSALTTCRGRSSPRHPAVCRVWDIVVVDPASQGGPDVIFVTAGCFLERSSGGRRWTWGRLFLVRDCFALVLDGHLVYLLETYCGQYNDYTLSTMEVCQP